MNELDHIIGQKLSAIVFIMDYYQFQFDGPSFDVLTPVTVISSGGRARSGDDQFRNLVCGQIDKVVCSVSLRIGEALTVAFDDDSQIQFSLKEQDYPGPEAVIFRENEGEWSVF